MTTIDSLRQRAPSPQLTTYRDRLIKKAKEAKPLPAPTRGGLVAAVIHSAFVVLSITGLIVTLGLALYLFIFFADPETLPFRLPFSDSAIENLASGVAVLVLEMAVLIGVLRFYDRFAARSRNRIQIFDVHEDLCDAIALINEARMKFAKRLDGSRTRDDLFSVDFGDLNGVVDELREDFILLSLCNPDHSLYIQHISTRILAIFDRMVSESYAAIVEARNQYARKDSSKLAAALNRLFDATDPETQSLNDMARILNQASKAI